MRHIYSDAHAAANVAATPGRHCKLMHDYGWRFAACPALCRCFSTKFARRTLCAHGRLTRACNAPMHGSSGALPLFLHEIRTRHALHPRQPYARPGQIRIFMTRACNAPMHGLRRTDFYSLSMHADPLTTPYMTSFTAARASLPVAQPSVPSSFSLSALQSS